MASIVGVVAVEIRDFMRRQPEVFDRIDSVLGDWGYIRLPGEERMQMVWRGRVAVDWPAEWADTHTWPHDDIFKATWALFLCRTPLKNICFMIKQYYSVLAAPAQALDCLSGL